MSEGGGAGARRGEQSDPGHREGWTLKLPHPRGPPILPRTVSEIQKIGFVCIAG